MIIIIFVRMLGTLTWSFGDVGSSKPADPEAAEICLKLKKIAGRLGLLSSKTTTSSFVLF